MTLPAGWPPRPGSSLRSIRFYATGTGTTSYADNAFLFINGSGANVYTPLPPVSPSQQTTITGTAELTNASTVVPSIAGTGQDPVDRSPQDASLPPVAQIQSMGIRVTAVSANVTISFDGTNDHGLVLSGTTAVYYRRHEAGIAVKGSGSTFYIEAW